MSDNTAQVVVFIIFVMLFILTIGKPDIIDGIIARANQSCIEKEMP